MLLVLILE
ncbi:hypothetical protein FWK35_00004267 [Aphis craccivora]|uniref:Uncharacterized protein n=1 Tax=Aphis craccivora TaxID=307492 RepID=A0A6G0ZPE7_APHCR|nr:hypothetical protein FWK35_00004267 [Aphis craccivora]